ncbi:MAG TPA: sulfatase [Phycisphaerae bacterium]|nr:sulfatase [Phycisphaerae bacterium]
MSCWTGRVDRRTFLRGLGATAALGALGARRRAGAAAPPRPLNFIIILVDDLGWTDLTCFGSKYYETPSLDRLASQGMKFTDAYAACAVCSPTRAAVMTGRYPARVGVTDWIRARFQGGKPPAAEEPEYVGGPRNKVLCPRNPIWMELDEVTLAEALKPAGYVSCHIGKWHLGPDEHYPTKQGFDFNLGGCDYGQPPSYFDPYTNARLTEGIPTLTPRKAGEYLTDRESDEAVGFLRKHRDRPFFLHMAHYAVHTPIQAKKPLTEKYQAKPPTNQKNATYAAMVQSVDESTGKILAALDDCGLADRTVVIFTSDNGGLLGPTHNAPLRAGKGYPYEGGIRVPLIVRWPGVVKPASLSGVPVTSVDYFPTILAAAGVKPPAGRVLDGVSLLPVLKGTGGLKRDAIYWHFPHYRGQIFPYSIIREGDWKLIRRYDGTQFELYNLKDDLSETTDLAAKMPEKVQALDAKLTAWLQHTGAKVPRPNPDYAPPAGGKKRA